MKKLDNQITSQSSNYIPIIITMVSYMTEENKKTENVHLLQSNRIDMKTAQSSHMQIIVRTI